ncbi:MAG: hypothetical protein COV91_04685 [Candidatus Taylorbacteria bacterium CG11_big_fil_rev_8_21_14_0_20_46_11]|uniref:Uncharacterized protein n=1 Tax=Candidatus Taylorbacteria bacterium CG11_big_fil_rev_8_21_14_0_20_46_11 TaxID=1975025 RepID=A0A2H0KCL7_9BACT|nr:MAG: hypothetical protein COV91_04685 [Candidatus Taylorbacteria bacterium CG11_big_fil_rev_8_21_14_0_20_46_11]
MDITKQKDELLNFLFDLPSAVQKKLNDTSIDVIMSLHDIGGAYGLVLEEVWWLYEGTRAVLTGEVSATTLPNFIKEHLEEEHQEDAGFIADDIQKKILDRVAPLFKEAGLPLQEGRVPAPPPKPIPSPFVPQPLSKGVASPYSSPVATEAPINATLSENHIRALTRIAGGTSYTSEKLQETFEDLPQGLQNAIASVDTANAVQEIAKKYFLHVDQMGNLASETGLVLLGITHPADFVGNLSRRLRIPEDKAKEIAKEISAQILGKVRDALRGLHEEPTQDSKQSTPVVREPLQKIEVMPTKASLVPTPTLATKPTIEVRTPYSAEATWNTGINKPPVTSVPEHKEENILEKQARENRQASFVKERPQQKEMSPSREEVMRGIENPRDIVGPTGWRPNTVVSEKFPARAPTGAGGKIHNSKLAEVPKEQPPEDNRTPIPQPQKTTPPSIPTPFTSKPIQPQSPTTQPPQPSPRPQTAQTKIKPASESLTPAPVSDKKKEEDTFLEQKLQGHMSIPKETNHYSSDPYREPLE